MYSKFGQFIDGKWQTSVNKETYDVINPATEEVIGKASKASTTDVDQALKSAEKGFEVWKKIKPWERSKIIRKIADEIRKKSKDQGQRHSLDALCRRFEIDDSSRTKHGALIDARILAKVYLAMTGGQSSLFQEVANTESNQSDPSLIKRVKENRDKIKVIYANKNELETHENYFQN